MIVSLYPAPSSVTAPFLYQVSTGSASKARERFLQLPLRKSMCYPCNSISFLYIPWSRLEKVWKWIRMITFNRCQPSLSLYRSINKTGLHIVQGLFIDKALITSFLFQFAIELHRKTFIPEPQLLPLTPQEEILLLLGPTTSAIFRQILWQTWRMSTICWHSNINRDIVFDVVNPFLSKRFPIDE